MTETYQRETVVKIIEEVQATVSQSQSAKVNAQLRSVLEDAISRIHAVRSEASGTNNEMPKTTMELSETIKETEDATNLIIENASFLQEKINNDDLSGKEELLNKLNEIVTACAFQDITGQRITKALSTLNEVEKNIVAIVNLLGPAISATDSESQGANDDGDDSLLNGPQLKENAMSQDDIDNLLDSFN